MRFTHIEKWRFRPIPELLSLQTAKMVEITKNLEATCLLLLDGEFQKMQGLATATSSLEKECDRIKEVLAGKLVDGRSPLPFTREDCLKLVQKVDGVVNQTALIAHKLLLYELKVPPSLVTRLRDLIKHITESVMHLQGAIDELRLDFKQARIDATMAEDKRWDARHLCWAVLKDLYHAPTDPLTLVLVREFIRDITGLADVVGRCSDFLVTLAITYSRIS